MLSNRRTALQTVERKALGGSYVDHNFYQSMFKKYSPFDFGVKTSQLFSSEPGSLIVNKKFTYMTIAQGNVYMLPGGVDDYQWKLVGSPHVEAYITELLVASNALPGKGGLSFKIALDKDWFHEPVLLKSENPNLPLLKILGFPVQRGANSFEYEVELQTSDPNAYIPVDYLQPGRRFIDIATQVSDELNTKYGGDQYAEMFKLQSHVGNVARKLEISDKAIRAEIAARSEGRALPTAGEDANHMREQGVGVGYVYQENFKSKKGDEIKAGIFITKAEARLLDRVEMDREMMMEFGQLQKTVDHDSYKPIKTAPGWRQLVRDGHYMQHNGSLRLEDIFEYLMTIFVGKNGFSDRYIRIATGEGGLLLMHRLIAEQAKTFTVIDTHFIKGTTSEFHSNALEFGAQFTKWRAPNGVIVELVYDPMKDNRQLFPELAPGTNYTLESFCMDIFDFGKTDQKATGASRDENITMVMQDGVEEYFTVSNVYDFATGAEKSGGNVYSNNKDLGIYRSMSGSLCIWDISRVGRIEFNPTV